MQKVNKEGGRVGRRGKRAARWAALARKGAEGRCGARSRADARAAVKRQGRRKGGEAVKGRAAASARVPCAPKAQKGCKKGAKRARTSDRARPRSLQCPALFCGGVCLVRQRGAGMVVAEGGNALPAQAVHGKVEGNAQCVHPDALRQQQRREHEPVAAVGKAA